MTQRKSGGKHKSDARASYKAAFKRGVDKAIENKKKTSIKPIDRTNPNWSCEK